MCNCFHVSICFSYRVSLCFPTASLVNVWLSVFASVSCDTCSPSSRYGVYFRLCVDVVVTNDQYSCSPVWGKLTNQGSQVGGSLTRQQILSLCSNRGDPRTNVLWSGVDLLTNPVPALQSGTSCLHCWSPGQPPDWTVKCGLLPGQTPEWVHFCLRMCIRAKAMTSSQRSCGYVHKLPLVCLSSCGQ